MDAVVRPPIGLAGLLTVDLANEPRVACLHELADRTSESVADLLSEPIIAAPPSLGPWRDNWMLTKYRSTPRTLPPSLIWSRSPPGLPAPHQTCRRDTTPRSHRAAT